MCPHTLHVSTCAPGYSILVQANPDTALSRRLFINVELTDHPITLARPAIPTVTLNLALALALALTLALNLALTLNLTLTLALP